MRTTKRYQSISGPSSTHFTLSLWLLFLFAPMALYVSGAIVFLLFALAVIFLQVAPDRLAWRAIRSDGASLWSLLALLCYALVSVAWARDGREAFYDWWRITLIISSGWLLVRCVSRLEPARCRTLLRGVLYGFTLLMVLLVVEWLGGGWLASLVKTHDTSNLLFTSRACALLAVFLWPITVICHQRFGAAAATVLFVVGVTLIGALPLLAASVAVVIAGAVFLFHYARPRFAPAALGTLIVAAVIAAPWVTVHASRYDRPGAILPADEPLPSSWAHRLVIWEFFAQRIEASPWWGHGLGTAHGLGDVPAALEDYQRTARPVGNAWITAQPPLHPHNAALQLWHDLGLAGVLGASAWLLVALRGLARCGSRRIAVAACLASGTAWLVIAGISFGLWQKWWLASGVISLAVCQLLSRGLDGERDG